MTDLCRICLEPEHRPHLAHECRENIRGRAKWQPIETAPLRTDVLLYVPRRLGDIVAMGCNSTGTQWWARNIGDLKPTHWMPLPPPPTETGADT